jgi:hypothetical protein
LPVLVAGNQSRAAHHTDKADSIRFLPMAIGSFLRYCCGVGILSTPLNCSLKMAMAIDKNEVQAYETERSQVLAHI